MNQKKPQTRSELKLKRRSNALQENLKKRKMLLRQRDENAPKEKEEKE